ncbi:MAG: hypothetical protein ISS70_15710 [Phycisphaerae bacterium]|nr:hypothetical protein [Phycisphaerae bacterium]
MHKGESYPGVVAGKHVGPAVDGRCQAYDGTIPDRKAIRKLGLRAGDVRNWNELVRLVAERVQSEEDFLEIFSQGTLETRFSHFKKGIKSPYFL